MTLRALVLHIAVIALLWWLGTALPEYHHGNLARIMVLATYALGFNILFGYTGLLSLGHAMFFAAGMYGCGLTVELLGWSAATGMAIGLICALVLGLAVGVLALRTTGVQFMIVTLLFAQAAFLTIIHFNEYTKGDEGFVLERATRGIAGIDLSQPDSRFAAALILFSLALIAKLWLVQSRPGRVLIAIRENEERARMLGFDPFRYKLLAVVASAGFAGAAGAAYAVLFGYVGASFAATPWSIFPLLWVLVGGPGTTLGPLLGTAAMFYLVDLASGSWMPGLARAVESAFGVAAPGLASAYMLLVGVALVLLVLFAPKGLLGTLRARLIPWLP